MLKAGSSHSLIRNPLYQVVERLRCGWVIFLFLGPRAAQDGGFISPIK